MNMSKFIVILLLLLAAQQQEGYTILFEGEDLAPIKEISLSANEHSIYVAYTPPDTEGITIVQLTPDLEEVRTVHVNELTSPSIKTYNDKVYLAAVNAFSEVMVIQEFTDDLTQVREHKIAVEEPVDVSICPYSEGIFLAYIHRFLEEGLLRQDVFVKKLDFSFTEIAENRLTNWDYWEEPCITVYNGVPVVSYSYTSLAPFMGRYIVVTTLDSQLEKVTEVHYPKDISLSRDNPLGKNVVQPDMTVIGSDLVLFFRMTDTEFSTTKFTLGGTVTVVPGNIRAVVLTEELLVEKEVAITADYREYYEPAVSSAFGRVYLAYSMNEDNGTTLHINYEESLDRLKMEPPPSYGIGIGLLIGIGFIAVVCAVLFLVVKSRSKSRSRSKPKKGKSKKGT